MAGNWLANWMGELAEEIGKLKAEGYELKAEGTTGPEVWVTIEGASEDTTTVRKLRPKIEKIMDASIKKHNRGVNGFRPQIQSYNRGKDIVLQCIVLFPKG